MSVSDIGGWNLDIHHKYNFHEGMFLHSDFKDPVKYITVIHIFLFVDFFLFIISTYYSSYGRPESVVILSTNKHVFKL